MRISVIGTGYVGLVTGACLSELGNDVVNADIDEVKIGLLQSGEIPIYEPGLEELVARNQREQRLNFTTDVEEAINFGDALFIAVGTPPGAHGAADLSAVFSVARKIAQCATESKVVVTKSTVPIGTGAKIQVILDEEGSVRHEAVSNPEFLKEGAAIKDFNDPDRIVVGTDSDHARSVLHSIYEPLARRAPSGRANILDMDLASAEMTKYAANAMLATRISFMNELARLCARVGADIGNVRRGIGLDPRIGMLFLNPGIGYGGSCFPKDVQAMIATGRENEVPFRILESVHSVNEEQKGILVDMIVDHFGPDLTGLHLAVWGLAFKPNTDDMREAPSIVIIRSLLAKGARITAYDPVAHESARRIFGDSIRYAENNYQALEGADAALLLTEWPEFTQPDLLRVRELLKKPVIFDGRNVYPLSRMEHAGFWYYSVGRPSIRPVPA
jgi:UDPglucose 6-dehydrogenase